MSCRGKKKARDVLLSYGAPERSTGKRLHWFLPFCPLWKLFPVTESPNNYEVVGKSFCTFVHTVRTAPEISWTEIGWPLFVTSWEIRWCETIQIARRQTWSNIFWWILTSWAIILELPGGKTFLVTADIAKRKQWTTKMVKRPLNF